VNVIAFVYAAFQAGDLAYQVVTGRRIINHHLRYHFDFFMDQASHKGLDLFEKKNLIKFW